MLFLARLSIRRPRAALAGWLAVAAALTLIGFGVSNTLSPSINVVPGTQSSRATQLANATFGPSQLIPILLEGPKAQLDKQGPKLVRALARRPYTRVLSAWDAGTASEGLRPKPTAAMMVVAVDRSEKDVVQYDEPQIESLVARDIARPVTEYITGQPAIDRAERSASISNLRKTELIAIAILFVLLLIGLRAPVAAVIVTAVGAISLLSGFGEVALLGHVMAVDPVGVAAGTMAGLALGVGFALLILDRFHREELPDGVHARDAVTAATTELRTTGKAVLVGGSALILALLLVTAVGPTQLMDSVGAGAVACAAFALGGAVVVMPAALVLLGRRIDAFSFPAPALLARVWSGVLDGGNWVTRHAIYSGFAATVLLAAIAVPAFALRSGQESPSQLPASSKARIAYDEISRVMGPGWATPYDVIIEANNRPITTPSLLASIYRFETKIAHNGTVASVDGPGEINSISSQLQAFGPSLKHSAKISDQSKVQLLQLANGLGQADAGSAQLQAGLASASSGASQLQAGSGSAQSGAAELHTGLSQAQAGSATLAGGLSSALTAANELKAGAASALAGATTLGNNIGASQAGVPQLTTQINSVKSDAASTSAALAGAQSKAQAALGAMQSAVAALNAMTAAAKSDPHYGPTAAALSQASAAVGGLSSTITSASASAAQTSGAAANAAYSASGLAPELNLLHTGASQLASGIQQLHNGNVELASGISQLAGGGGSLNSGLSQLTAGAGELQTGLGQLTDGTGQLYSGLAGGVAPAGQLTAGLGTMQAAVVKARGQIPSTASLKALEQESPGIFSSGYFVLSAVAGAPPAERNDATFTINLLRGGTAGQIMVVSKYASNDPRTSALGATLVKLGVTFAKRNNLRMAVGGPEGDLGDLTSVTKSRVPTDIVVLALAIVLVLSLALRAVLLPAVATSFSLLVAGSTFGILQVLFGGSNPPLGGPGYLDPITIISVFTLTFGITIIYSTLLLMQTRDAYVSEPGDGAVRGGLRQTAAAATGAGLVMIAATIPFATTDLINVRELGIGVTAAILLEIVLVRPVLLPAAEAVLGRAGWWPTSSPRPTGSGTPRRVPVPHRRPRPAAQ